MSLLYLLIDSVVSKLLNPEAEAVCSRPATNRTGEGKRVRVLHRRLNLGENMRCTWDENSPNSHDLVCDRSIDWNQSGELCFSRVIKRRARHVDGDELSCETSVFASPTRPDTCVRSDWSRSCRCHEGHYTLLCLPTCSDD